MYPKHIYEINDYTVIRSWQNQLVTPLNTASM